MTTQKQAIFVTILGLYLATVLLTDFSLVGFWTDIIFSILFSLYVLRLVFKNKTHKLWLTLILRTISVLCSLIIFGLLGFNLTNPFVRDTFKLRSFYYQSVDGRLFNAYFKPVGSYSGGEGNFWITEVPKFFPIIEKRVYYDRTVLWNFNNDTSDGQPVNNYEVVKEYIKNEIIDKKK
jgi:hypothetical protein